ncbi:hypothetical protein JHK86_042806 [Glycine max]|nr:hypothetical protein JHK86_042806 [Glycine max]
MGEKGRVWGSRRARARWRATRRLKSRVMAIETVRPTEMAREKVRRNKARKRMLEKRSLRYNGGPVPVSLDDEFVADNVQRI